MTPRTEIISLSSDSNVRNFKDIYAEHSHSRFPVYEGSEDNIIGIISTKDILMGISKKKTDDETKIKEIIRKPYFVPETKRNFEIFNEMRLSGDKIAIIIDEYGGLSGVMTLKKLLEEKDMFSEKYLLRWFHLQDLPQILLTVGVAYVISELCLVLWGGEPMVMANLI